MWEYDVRTEYIAEFEKIYSASGAWAEFFQNSKEYLGTELLVDQGRPHRYITIDRWRSSQDYESFLSKWKNEYEHLDAQCAGLTEREFLLSKWETQ